MRNNRNNMRSHSVYHDNDAQRHPTVRYPAGNGKTWVRDIINTKTEYCLISFVKCFANQIATTDREILMQRLEGESKVYLEDVKLIKEYLDNISMPADRMMRKIVIDSRAVCVNILTNNSDLVKRCRTTNRNKYNKDTPVN